MPAVFAAIGLSAEQVAAAGAVGVVDRLGDCRRAASRVAAERSATVAALHDVRAREQEGTGEDFGFTSQWHQLVADVGARMRVSTRVATSMVDTAMMLRDRLPRLFDLLFHGVADERVVRVVVSRCELIESERKCLEFDKLICAYLTARPDSVFSAKDIGRISDRLVARVDSEHGKCA